MPTPAPIDLDRGVIMRIVPSNSGTHMAGMHVCMYADAPGVYLAPNSLPISPELAKLAGFDVEEDLKEKRRNERRAAALAAVDKEFEIMAEGEIVDDGDDFQIVHMGRGWFDVLDTDGKRMNEGRLRRDAAAEYVDVLRKGKEHVDGQASEGR